MQLNSVFSIFFEFYSVLMSFLREMIAKLPQRLRFLCFLALFFLCTSFSLTISAKQASAGLIRDTELEHGFSELVKEMAAKAGFPDGVEIRLVMDNRYNAFVAGGKTIYVHSGLLLEAQSAEEILGLLHMKSATLPLAMSHCAPKILKMLVLQMRSQPLLLLLLLQPDLLMRLWVF